MWLKPTTNRKLPRSPRAQSRVAARMVFSGPPTTENHGIPIANRQVHTASTTLKAADRIWVMIVIFSLAMIREVENGSFARLPRMRTVSGSSPEILQGDQRVIPLLAPDKNDGSSLSHSRPQELYGCVTSPSPPSGATSMLVLHSTENGSDTFSLDLVPETPHSFRMFLEVVHWHIAKQFLSFCHQQ